MFTGIIEEKGKIKAIKRGAASSVLSIEGSVIFDDLKIGDSVAVNGVCLTATKIEGGAFEADVMHETLDRTGLGQLRPGSAVNLERAMAHGRKGDGGYVRRFDNPARCGGDDTFREEDGRQGQSRKRYSREICGEAYSAIHRRGRRKRTERAYYGKAHLGRILDNRLCCMNSRGRA